MPSAGIRSSAPQTTLRRHPESVKTAGNQIISTIYFVVCKLIDKFAFCKRMHTPAIRTSRACRAGIIKACRNPTNHT